MPLLRGQGGDAYGRSEGSSRPGLATAYAMRKKMAKGGEACPDCASGRCMKHGGMMAEGGGVHKSKRDTGAIDKWASDNDRKEKQLNEIGSSIAKAADTIREKRKQREANEGPNDDLHTFHLAEGGEVDDRDIVSRIMKRRSGMMAEGGAVLDDEKKYKGTLFSDPKEKADQFGQYSASQERSRDRDTGKRTDMVSRIMRKRNSEGRRMSEGGRVSNEEHGPDQDDLAGYSPNEFDVLELGDDLNDHDTGANSGDELGDEQENEDRGDMISRIMKSRRLKDRNPRPA